MAGDRKVEVKAGGQLKENHRGLYGPHLERWKE
jgi:hypothetical protein